jgi:hypothetical protein
MFWVFIEFEKLSRDPKARAMFACCIHRGREAFAQSMLAVALVFVVAIAQCARARLSASHRPSPSRLHAATKPCDRDSSERAERRHTIQVQSLHYSLAKLSSRHCHSVGHWALLSWLRGQRI